jgi:hypothetical protein
MTKQMLSRLQEEGAKKTWLYVDDFQVRFFALKFNLMSLNLIPD